MIGTGAPVSASVIKTFQECLNQKAQIYTPYGATESLPVAIADSGLILGETERDTKNGAGVCVGQAVQGIQIKVIKISDDPISSWDDSLELPVGEVGEIIVQGEQVTGRYYGQEDATEPRQNKKHRKWWLFHRMGDLGYFDQKGRLWFCGRKSHRVVLDEKKEVFTVPGESIINTHKEVRPFRNSWVGSGKYRRPVLCIEPTKELAKPDMDRVKNQLVSFAHRILETKELKEILFLKTSRLI